MAKSAWQRTGAFVGTVTAVALVAKTVRPSRGPAVIDAAGNVFRNSLYAAMGGTYEEVVNYQRVRPLPVPYLWDGIYYRLLSLFPQVAMPYEVDWHRWVELVYGEEWEDASLDWAGIEYFGNLVGELRESYESR